jgi:catechol 2,3-dioxygenase-like lactoylglutathione lyase family enzyme
VRDQKLIAFVAVRDLRRAKEFYGDALGLHLVSEDEFALVFDASGTMLRVTRVPELTAAQYTVLGWQVDDIISAVKELRNAGITLERYPGMAQDELGIWNSPSGARVAWFKDPDGNTLSLTESQLVRRSSLPVNRKLSRSVKLALKAKVTGL